MNIKKNILVLLTIGLFAFGSATAYAGSCCKRGSESNDSCQVACGEACKCNAKESCEKQDCKRKGCKR